MTSTGWLLYLERAASDRRMAELDFELARPGQDGQDRQKRFCYRCKRWLSKTAWRVDRGHRCLRRRHPLTLAWIERRRAYLIETGREHQAREERLIA